MGRDSLVLTVVRMSVDKEISQERMAVQKPVGRKYSLRLEKSVSGDSQKRKATVKAEPSAIKADTVKVTSPVKRAPPSVTAARPPPRPQQVRPDATRRGAPPPRPPAYSLCLAPPTRQPVVRKDPARKTTTAGRKPGVETRLQTTKAEVARIDSRARSQKAAVEKPPIRTRGVPAKGPPRVAEVKKPVNATRQQTTQRVVPAAQATTRRPAATAERPKLPRVVKTDAAPRKSGLRKVRGTLPVDENKSYAMEKFMAQRESQLSVSIPLTPEKPSVSNIRVVTESDEDVSDVVNMLLKTYTDQTFDLQHDALSESLPITDELQHLKTDTGVDGFAQPPQTTPNLPGSHLKDTADEQNRCDGTSSKKAAGNVVEDSETAKTASATEVRSESRNNEAYVQHEELMLDNEWCGFLSDKMELCGVQKDGETWRHSAHEDWDKMQEKAVVHSKTELRSDDDRSSSYSEFDDHQTLPDDEGRLVD